MADPPLLTADGVVLAGRRWAADGAPRAAVVLVHGFSASKDDPAVGSVARHLAGLGHDVVSYDGRGHGASEGLCTLGDDERHDVAAAVAEARSRAQRVVVVGASMGAIAVLRHAAADDSLAGVVSVSSPSRWRVPRTMRSLLAAGVTQTGAGRWLAARHLRVRLAAGWTRAEPPAALAARIGAPLVVVHGLRDRFIPATEAVDLASVAAPGPRRLMLVPGMGHAYEAAAVPAICEAVEWALAASAARVPQVAPSTAV